MSTFTAHEVWLMEQALKEASWAAENNEVPVGAVVVNPHGQIVSSAQNQVIEKGDPTAHAEILAIRAAAKVLGNYRLSGHSLFTTIEPCPMCLGAALHARLERIVFGAVEPKWGAAVSLIRLGEIEGLNHQLKIEGGLLAEQCGQIISLFFQAKRKGK
ncbi:MAG: tRNA adenosine(34) deaminase TadA [Candidatus Adiutrix sp.]